MQMEMDGVALMNNADFEKKNKIKKNKFNIVLEVFIICQKSRHVEVR